jgi:hypothetical protein
MTSLRLLIFAIFCIAGVYLFSSLYARKFKKIEPSRALLFISAVAMIGVLGEIFVDSIYAHFFSTPLWRYNFLPIHSAYTSKYAPVLWGTLGLYLYFMHGEKWTPKQITKLSIIFGFEAMILEAVVDLASRPILGDYIYYYYPNGLAHISAFQNFPFYFLCGRLMIQTVYFFRASPRYFTTLASWVTMVTVYFK